MQDDVPCFASFSQLVTSWIIQLNTLVRNTIMATHTCNDGSPCPVPPHPRLLARLLAESSQDQQALSAAPHLSHTHDGSLPLSIPTGYVVGLNDGTIFPKSHFEAPLPERVMANAALERAPLRGVVRSVVYILTEFVLSTLMRVILGLPSFSSTSVTNRCQVAPCSASRIYSSRRGRLQPVV